MIGDVFGSFNKFHPFSGKPDVLRIDDPEKLYSTSFCVDQLGGENTPYTDKVILFAMHLINNEQSFVKTINRISKRKFNEIKECALWGT